MLELHKIASGYGKKQVLTDISAAFHPGELTVILGPNGCGKSTLLKTVLGLLPAVEGQLLLDGVPLAQMEPGQIAKKIAWLPQGNQAPNMTAEQLVLCGRFPHLSYPRRYGRKDRQAARAAMEQLGIGHLADTSVLAVNRHDHIGLVQAGQRHQGIGTSNIFTLQKILLPDITVDDIRLRQKLAQFPAARIILLNNPNGNSGFFQLGSKIIADPAAAADRNITNPAGQQA